MTDEEEYEYLSLKRKRALAIQSSPVPTPKQDNFEFPRTGLPGFDIGTHINPETGVAIARPVLEQGGFLAGETIGTEIAPGPGTIMGAGIGQGAGSVAANSLESFVKGQPQPSKEEMMNAFGSQAAIGAGSALAGAGTRKLLKAGSKVKEALSGVGSERFGQLIKNPSAILPTWMGGPKSIKEAGTLLGEAEKAVGIEQPTVGELVNFKRSGLNKAAMEELDTIEKTVKAGIPLDNFKPQTLLDNIGRVDRIIKSESASEYSELSARAKMLRKSLVEALSKNEPDLQAARQVYHQSALHREFTSPAMGLLPKNKGGTISRLVRYAIPGVAGAALGLANQNKMEGAGFGLGVGAMESPLVLGGLTALGATAGPALGLPLSLGLSAYARSRNKK